MVLGLLIGIHFLWKSPIYAYDRIPTEWLGSGISSKYYLPTALDIKGSIVNLGTEYSWIKKEYLLEENIEFSQINHQLSPFSSFYSYSHTLFNQGRLGIRNPLLSLSVPSYTMEKAPIFLMSHRLNGEVSGKFKIFSNFVLNYGHKLTDEISLLVNYNHFNVHFDISGYDADLDNHLLTISGERKSNVINALILYRFLSLWQVALQVDILNYVVTSYDLRILAEESARDAVTERTRGRDMWGNRLQLSLSYTFKSKHEFNFDLIYNRYPRVVKRISIADGVSKELDTYDTLSPGFLYFFKCNNYHRLSLAVRYQPGDVGQGSKVVGNKTGYGLWDVYLYQESPAQKYALGYSWKVWEPADSSLAANIILNLGLVYIFTDVGVDRKGENPGVFTINNFKFPFSIQAVF